jgi:hypothetical protein
MRMNEKDRVRRVLATVLDAEVSVDDLRADTWPVIVRGFKPAPRFCAVWVRRGWPSEVREATKRAPEATLLLAPAFSPGAREFLDERALNWADETGGARIHAAGLIVRLDGDPIPEPKPKALSWSPAGVRAAEAILTLAPEQIATAWLAEHARCSVARASGILQQWDAEGWTIKSGPPRGRSASRTLNDAGSLLDAWTAHLNSKPMERWFAHTTSRDLLDIEATITETMAGLTIAWTGWAAAAELAPFVTQLPVLHLRVGEGLLRRDVEPGLRKAGLTVTDAAGRVELWRTNEDAFAYVAPSQRGPLCSWPRVYADLVRIGGRGVDAAEHLRDEMSSNR